MTRHQRLEKELKELNDQIELAVTQISHLSQVLSDEAFGMVAVDKAILDEIRGEIAGGRKADRHRHHLT